MRNLLVLLLTVLFMDSAIASNCMVYSVSGFDAHTENLRSQIEQILEKKGYQVVQAGNLYINDDLNNLKIRQDLLKNQNLVAVFNNDTGQTNSTMCIKYLEGTIECAFDFTLYKVKSNRLVSLVRINKTLSKKPWLFGSERKVIDGFVNDVYQVAVDTIPNCSN